MPALVKVPVDVLVDVLADPMVWARLQPRLNQLTADALSLPIGDNSQGG
ncbi:MAG: hypothetical protein AAFY83_13565 [Pseudomonadota bacterium]